MPRLWTQLGLSLEMLFHPADVLFIPAHVVPIIHPKNTIVTVHGLEFEIFPEGYSFWARLYMRWSIKMSCKWAKKIIVVSENTKKDLMKLYDVPEGKIEVIYEGVGNSSSPFGRGCPVFGTGEGSSLNSKNSTISQSTLIRPSATFSRGEKGIFLKPYLLFIGRLEKRKNIEGIIDAYKILIEKYKIPHSLVLAGAPGYGYDVLKLKIQNYFKIQNSKFKIIEPGFVDEATKQELLKNADIFLFPTFYEGFGLPVLEAQSVGVPVVCSNTSSLPEIITSKVQPWNQNILELSSKSELSAVLCDPQSPNSIAEAAYSLISNPTLKNDIIKKGYENVKRFSWGDCSFRVSKILTNGNK